MGSFFFTIDPLEIIFVKRFEIHQKKAPNAKRNTVIVRSWSAEKGTLLPLPWRTKADRLMLIPVT